jgi:uncharacterized protein
MAHPLWSLLARGGIRLLVGSVLLGLQSHGMLLGSVYAASFECGPRASASERAVCGDPAMSALDDRLARVYRRALDTAVDKSAIEADRITQWQWRQRNCSDKACVRDWYERRIGELKADIAVGRQAQHDSFEHSLAAQHLAPSTRTVLQNLQNFSGL